MMVTNNYQLLLIMTIKDPNYYCNNVWNTINQDYYQDYCIKYSLIVILINSNYYQIITISIWITIDVWRLLHRNGQTQQWLRIRGHPELWGVRVLNGEVRWLILSG